MPKDLDPGELLAVATALAVDAGALLLERLGRTRTSVSTKSSPTDMVTEVDRASERLVVEGLRAARPGDGVLAEEGSEDVGTTGVRWVVDPLDGTTNYLYDLPAFTVSIAAEVEGRAVVAVVRDPSRGETFAAVRGQGARLGRRTLRCRPPVGLDDALVGTGFSYERAGRARQAEVLRTVLPRVRDIRRGGSAALDLCWVGAGRLDAFYEKGLAPWDRTAGALIASEAGATVGDLDGGPASDRFTLAATPGLWEALGRLLAGAGAGAA